MNNTDKLNEEIEEENSNTEEFSGPKSQFPYHAAMFSLFAPFVAMLMNFLSKNASPPTPFLIACISMVIYPTSLVLGIIALCFIKRYGKEGILIRSILGIIINAAIITMVIATIPAIRQARKNAIKMNRYQFIPPPGFGRYENLAKTVPDALDAYVKGNINDTNPDIILIIEDIKGTIAKDEDISSVALGNPNVKVLKYSWHDHAINVFRIEEKVNNVATLTYNAQIPVIPAIQVKIMGLEARDQELKDDLDKAINGISGKSNWD